MILRAFTPTSPRPLTEDRSVSYQAACACGLTVTWTDRPNNGSGVVVTVAEHECRREKHAAFSTESTRLGLVSHKRAPAADLAESDGCSDPYKEGLR